jgi:Surface antigen variable number repeat
MRVPLSLVLLGCYAVTSMAQTGPATVCRIHKLIITSTDLPDVERHSVIREFQGRTDNLDELAARIGGKLRESGYARAEVGAAQFTRSPSAPSNCTCDVSYTVHAGNRYRLSEITFRLRPGKPVFPSSQLRAQFALEDGAIFNNRQLGEGLNNLRDLYVSAGFPNNSALPTVVYDDAHSTVTLNIEIDQGFAVSFGKLLLEGVEPKAGVARQLVAAWKEVDGKRYSPQLLKDWLKRNTAGWPTGAASQVRIEYIGVSAYVRDVLLHFQ